MKAFPLVRSICRSIAIGSGIGRIALLSTPWIALGLPAGAVSDELPAKLGAYYFDGWTSQSTHLTRRLVTEFGDREPRWGWHDDSLTTMQIQIDCAADAGLRFFAFDWYYPEGPNKYTPLNTALNLYLQSSNRGRLEFCLLVANHSGFVIGPADWDHVSDLWVELFRQPTYLKMRGKPLLIFFSPRDLRRPFGGTSEGVKAAFDALQGKAKRAGWPGVEIAACATPGPEGGWDDLNELQRSGYTCLTGYNYHGWPRRGRETIQAFATLIEGHEEIWRRFAARSPLPYIPVVTTGWDKRPWEDRDTTATQDVYYPDRTPVQVADGVARAVDWVREHPSVATPDRLILLYAWNENGEGGYITPCRGDDGAYLEAISRVPGIGRNEGVRNRPWATRR